MTREKSEMDGEREKWIKKRVLGKKKVPPKSEWCEMTMTH